MYGDFYCLPRIQTLLPRQSLACCVLSSGRREPNIFIWRKTEGKGPDYFKLALEGCMTSGRRDLLWLSHHLKAPSTVVRSVRFQYLDFEKYPGKTEQ